MSRNHPFREHPHRTLVGLSLPVLLSLVAEPLTGLVDTAFVSRLGSVQLAALGVGTMALSAIFWGFNFLGIGTQTDVAQADGGGDEGERAAVTVQALAVGFVLGTVAARLLWPLTPAIVRLLGAHGEIADAAIQYTTIRWMGAPAIVLTVAGFGVLRGRQNMRVPLWIALGLNAVNIGLDAWLIPEHGIAGAAWATVAAQWAGAVAVLVATLRDLGARPELAAHRIRRLFRVGRDIVLRTALLTAFLVVTTREATRIGADAGAAHQAIRQFWIFTALFLDAFAIAGQSLIGYFVDDREQARKVAVVVLIWSFGFGLVLALGMWMGEGLVARMLVPENALVLFSAAWLPALLFQPLNALAFGTDGIHWGTADFVWLRNATAVATLVGVAVLYAVPVRSLTTIWWVTGLWILVRVIFGMGRIWPGSRNAPLGAVPYLPAD